MSTEKDLTPVEKTNGHPSPYDKETETLVKPLSHWSLANGHLTRERDAQSNKEGFEESQETDKETMHQGSEKSNETKLIPVPFGNKESQITVTANLSTQATQPPSPSNQTDDDSSVKQQSTSSQSSSSSQRPSSSSHAGSSLKQLPTTTSRSDSQCTDEIEKVEAVHLHKSNIEDTTADKCSSCDVAYQKELCDEILKSDPLRGVGENQTYFTELYNNLCNRIRELNILDKTETEFSAIDNDYERIEYALQFEEVKKLSITICNSKSESYADALEEEYNNCCQETDRFTLNRGLQLINRSIQLTSGTQRKLLGIRLMKRGWINILLTRFDEAREDAHRSLEYYRDSSVMWNSFEILGHCYAKKTDNGRAEHFFKEALAGLRQCDIDNETKAAAAKRISSVYKFVKGRKDMGGAKKNSTDDLKTPQISYGINGILKCATDAVQVKVKGDTGRGLYAKRDIKPGDVIIVEQPYVSALNRENFETHCNYCYKRFRSSIPCDTCSRVWFCSKECLKNAKDGFHSSECHVLNLLYEESIGSMGIIVFRILSRLTWENIKSLRKSKKIDTRLPDSHPLHTEFNWKEKYFTDDYQTTYKLVTNSQKRNFGDLFKRTVTAVYIKQCLKVVDFFRGDASINDEIFVASLILRHLQNSSCNAYGIIEFIIEGSSMNNVDILELGGGIYPTISLINHSCDPNVFRYSVGKDCIVRATKSIEKGEQLFDNYCRLYDMLDRESRRAVLKSQYKFHCDCIACKENWPLYVENKVYTKLSCPEEKCDQIVEYDGEDKMICPSCGFKKKHEILMTEVKGKIKEYRQGVDSFRGGLRDKATVTIKRFQMYADKNLIPPSKCLTECQDIFKRCFLLQGNLFKSNR